MAHQAFPLCTFNLVPWSLPHVNFLIFHKFSVKIGCFNINLTNFVVFSHCKCKNSMNQCQACYRCKCVKVINSRDLVIALGHNVRGCSTLSDVSSDISLSPLYIPPHRH